VYCYKKSTVVTTVLLSLTFPVGVASSKVVEKDSSPSLGNFRVIQAPISQQLQQQAPIQLAETPKEAERKIPKITIPQIQLPEIPKITIPQIQIPQIQIPEIPQVQIPEIPKITIPQVQILEIPKTNPSQIIIPQPQQKPKLPIFIPPQIPTQNQGDNVFSILQKQEEARIKREQEVQEAQKRQAELEETRRELERQNQLELLRRLPENLRIEVQTAIGIYQMGRYEEALKKLQWILDAQRKNGGERKDEATTLTVIAFVYNGLGRYSKALNYCEQALEIHQKIGDKEGVSIALNCQGSIHYSVGQYSKALRFYEQALAIVKQNGYKFKESATLVNIADVYIRQKNNSPAIKLYEQSLAILKQLNNQQTVQSNEKNKNDSEEINIVADTSKDKSNGNDKVDPEEIYLLTGQALSGIGEAYHNLGNYHKALESYQQALSIQEKIGNQPRQAETLRKIGTVYVNQNNYSQALNYYQRALDIAQITDDKVEKAKSLNSIGFVYINQGRYTDAEKSLFTAVQTWESLRRGLSDDQKISIFENQVTSYQFLQKALVAQNKHKLALQVAERGRSRAFVELLASRQSFNANNKANIKPPLIQEIQKIAQQQSSTIVQYSIIKAPSIRHNKVGDNLVELRPSELYIWVVKPTGEIVFRQVNLTSESDLSFDRLILKSRDLMRTRGRNSTEEISQRSNTLQQLHDILIKPIISELPENPNESVIFVPQGELFLLPFAALQDDTGKYLIEKHTLLTVPAIQVLQLTHQQKLRNGQISFKRPLVVGNPVMPSLAQEVGGQQERLLPLPGAEQEALQIGKILNTQPLTGSSATETSIKRYIGSAGIVHLATHGLLDDIKGFGVPGAIALTPQGQDDGLLTSNELFDMKLNADLVVLSACDTGRGDIKGDGIIGLSRSLIAAGAPSVIVSLWAVSDESTAYLMTNFYKNLQQNPNKALALRSAMLTTMKKYPQPLNWAPFTLIGEAD
jgi:CHAT domain-containing protein/Tfp pilus assembly protein PilF